MFALRTPVMAYGYTTEYAKNQRGPRSYKQRRELKVSRMVQRHPPLFITTPLLLPSIWN